MQTPLKANLKIYQGSTFSQIFRWESNVLGYVTITGITKAAPAVVTAVAHNIPAGWRFTITDVAGMKEINDSATYRTAVVKSVDSLELNDVNSLSYTAYTSGGVIKYNKPVDLAAYTARMQIRSSLSSTASLEELTTENGKISIDTVNKTITLNLSATVTAAYSWSAGVYSLEMISPTGVVDTIAVGSVSLVKEVTR